MVEDKRLLIDTHGAEPSPFDDSSPRRNPSLWRSTPENPQDPFTVLGEIYRQITGKVYKRDAEFGTEDDAYVSFHTTEVPVMQSINAAMTSPEFHAVVTSAELSQKQKAFEAQIIARRQISLDRLAPRSGM